MQPSDMQRRQGVLKVNNVALVQVAHALGHLQSQLGPEA